MLGIIPESIFDLFSKSNFYSFAIYYLFFLHSLKNISSILWKIVYLVLALKNFLLLNNSREKNDLSFAGVFWNIKMF